MSIYKYTMSIYFKQAVLINKDILSKVNAEKLIVSLGYNYCKVDELVYNWKFVLLDSKRFNVFYTKKINDTISYVYASY